MLFSNYWLPFYKLYRARYTLLILDKDLKKQWKISSTTRVSETRIVIEEIAIPYWISSRESVSRKNIYKGFLLTLAFEEMGVLEIDIEKLLPQKRCHKNKFSCICTIRKANCIGATKEDYRKN